MKHHAFNPLTRRTSILALGMAGLAAFGRRPVATSARKNHGKKNGRKGDDTKL